MASDNAIAKFACEIVDNARREGLDPIDCQVACVMVIGVLNGGPKKGKAEEFFRGLGEAWEQDRHEGIVAMAPYILSTVVRWQAEEMGIRGPIVFDDADEAPPDDGHDLHRKCMGYALELADDGKDPTTVCDCITPEAVQEALAERKAEEPSCGKQWVPAETYHEARNSLALALGSEAAHRAARDAAIAERDAARANAERLSHLHVAISPESAALAVALARIAELTEALELCRDAIDGLMGDTDLDGDDSLEFRAMQAATAALAGGEKKP